MRAATFGVLLFLDHAEVNLFGATYHVLLIVDAASSFLAAYAQLSLDAGETIDQFREWMETYHCAPTAVCADMAFATKPFADFFRHHGIRPLLTGPGTPWPNRAEAAVRLFNLYLSDFIQGLHKHPELQKVTPRSLFRKAAMARNMAVTYGGKSPVELAFGRRPRGVLNAETQDLEQLTAPTPEGDQCEEDLQRLAMKVYLEARQREDIRRVLAVRFRTTGGPFQVGDLVYFWQEDPSKIKRGRIRGYWIKGRISGQTGAMCILDVGTQLLRLNQSKLRKAPDDWADVEVPLGEEPPSGVSLAETFWLAENEHAGVLEVYTSSMRLSSAFANTTAKVGPPVGLALIFDLSD